MPGKKSRSLKDTPFYEKLRAKGKSKESAAKISNAKAAKSKKRRPKKPRRSK